MRYVLFLFLSLCLMSCDYFDKKKISSEEILQEDLRTFNWNEVDDYPSFASCDSSSTKESRKQCFKDTLIKHLTQKLIDKKIVVTEAIEDTVKLKLSISEKGAIEMIAFEASEHVMNEIPDIEQYLRTVLKELPQISPAIKRGQQVKTEFTLPLLIKT